MDGVNLYNDRELHWRMVSEDDYGGVNFKKALLHAKKWDVYVN